MTRFIIFRHGPTNWTFPIRYCGSNDIPLSEEGRKQARLLAKRLKHEKIDVVYSSPLSRAYETANIINQHHKKEIVVLEDLREMCLGELEGKTKEERLQTYPWFDWFNDEHRKKLNIDTISHWENIFKTETILTLLKKHPNQTILLSTHYFKIQTMLLGLGIDKEIIVKTRLKPCGVSIIEKTENDTKIVSLNDVSHMELKN